MDKKSSLSVAAVAGIILGLVFMIVGWTMNNNMGQDINSLVEDRVCALSIITSNQDKIADFDCEAKRLTISKDDFEGEKNVKKELANKLTQFWYTVGEGENQPYPLKNTFNEICLIGYIIEFKEIGNIRGLNFFMTQNVMEGKTYHRHIYSNAPTTEEIEEFQKQEDIYDTSMRQAIIWRVNNIGSHDYQSVEIIPYQEVDKRCTVLMN